MKATKDQIKKYNELAKEAKGLVRMLRLKNIHRVRVAQIALESCEIIHGGRAPENRATLKKFAEKIDLNYRTMYEWIRYYRIIYLKLDAKDKRSFEAMSANTLKYIVSGLSEKSRDGTVRSKFKKYAKKAPVEQKLWKYACALNAILFNVNSFKRSLKMPDDILLEYEKKCREIVTYIEAIKKSRFEGKLPVVRKIKIKDSFWDEEIRLE